MLRMLETHYAAARELRFPLNDCLPGLRVAKEIIHRIGATLNYRDLRPEGTPWDLGWRLLRPRVPSRRRRSSRQQPVGADHYDVPLQPINLRIVQHATSLAGKLEFNEALIPASTSRL